MGTYRLRLGPGRGLGVFSNDNIFKEGEAMHTKNELKHIGIRVSYLRRLRGLDQEQLATKVGISRSYLSKIESGRGVEGVPLALYMAIADGLGIPAWKLLVEDV